MEEPLTKQKQKPLSSTESIKAVELESSGQSGGWQRLYGGKDTSNVTLDILKYLYNNTGDITEPTVDNGHAGQQ